MMTWADMLVAGLWRAGWAVVPVALVVAAVCRFSKCNATTRHALWLTTFAAFIAAVWLPGATMEPPPAPEPVYFVGSQISGDGSSTPIPFVPLVRGSQSKPWRPEPDENATTAQVAASVEPTPPRTAACSADSSTAWLASTANRLRRLSIPCLDQIERAWQWVRADESQGVSASEHDESLDVVRASIAHDGDSGADERNAECRDELNSPLVDAVTSAVHSLASIPFVLTEGWSKARTEMNDAIAAAAMNRNPPARPRVEPSSQADIAAVISMLGPVRTTSNPEELDPWPGEPGAQFSAAAEWQRFVSRLLGVRDAVGLVPPLPTTVWAVGFLGLATVLMLRTISAARRLRKALPADVDTICLVEREARRLGLKSPPQTLLIDDRVSPLIWCGRRVRLVLPRSFWTGLDHEARRAVICHELAHIRRRDHWVRRFEILVTCLYWWHPVMWYVRARMAEEADACCDEWVTWVLPRERRAYARALLAATDYVNGGVAPKPFAVAMASARAAKIARRLTMIMTATRRPGLGMAGACGVLALGALAWVATPVQSCPPEEGETKAPVMRNSPVTVRTISAPQGEIGAQQSAPDRADVTRVRADWDEAALSSDPELAARLRQIEESQKRLSEELRQLSQALGRSSETTPAPAVARLGSMRSTVRPAPPAMPALPAAPASSATTPVAASPFAEAVSVIPGTRPQFDQPIVSRVHKLSGDRLEALTELMLRDDVPVCIIPTEGGIQVNGTEAQQAVFAAFVKMITADDKAAEIKLPREKMEAVQKLAALESVPTRFVIGPDSISVQGTAAEQAVFDAFIALIHPKTPGGQVRPVAPMPAIPPMAPGQPAAPRGPNRKPGRPGQPAGAAMLEQSQAELESRLKTYADAMKSDLQAGQLKETLLQLERSNNLPGRLIENHQGFTADAHRIYEQADAVLKAARAEADKKRIALRARSDELSAQRDKLEGQADHLEAEANAVEARAASAEKSEAEALKRQARELRTQATRSRREAARLDTQIDKIADAVAELEIEAAGSAR